MLRLGRRGQVNPPRLHLDLGDQQRLTLGADPAPCCTTALVGSDRFSAYGHLTPQRRQVCWARLRRAFEEFVARGGEAERVGQHLLDRSEQLFTWCIKSATAPCHGPAFRTGSTICVCGFGFICGRGSGSPTPRRRPPAPISSTSSRFVKRLLTVRDTRRQQQRNVLDYLRMACDAAVSQQPAPSLLPSTHSAIR